MRASIRSSFALLGLLCLALPLRATFPVTNANINNGSVMPQSPVMPFPQFNEYDYGKTVVNNPPPGVSHVEMEREAVHMYIEMMHRLIDMPSSWKPAALPHRFAYATTGCGVGNQGCSEEDGMAMLAAALMCDKDTFDGLWIQARSFIAMIPSYESATPGTMQYGSLAGSCDSGGVIDWNHAGYGNGATDGDEDAALALLIAWKNWGDNMGYTAADGTAMSYKRDFNYLVHGMIAMRETSLGSGVFAPIPGADAPKVRSGEIGWYGFVKKADSVGEVTSWDTTTTQPGYPQATGYCSAAENYLSYLAPGHYRCFSGALTDEGDTYSAMLYERAANSSEYIIGQLVAQRTPWSIGTDNYTVNQATSAVAFTGNWGAVSEGVRTPWRNALAYLWYGQPAEHWDVANHVVLAGAPAVNYQRRMASTLSEYAWNPSDPAQITEVMGTGLTFWGPSQLQPGIAQNGAPNGTPDRIPTIFGPMSMAALAGDDVDADTGVNGRQYDLIHQMYRQLVDYWDKDNGSAPDGSGLPYPKYFHDFYRVGPFLAMTGNFHKPCEMAAAPNMKIYKSVNSTIGFTGDTLTYVLSYRNFGSAAATNVTINDPVPSQLQVLATQPAASVSGNSVTFSIGTVPGFQFRNYSATEGAVTITAVVLPGFTGRICNTATISVNGSLAWTSGEYPNELSMIYKKNCVDIISRALSLTKTASPSMVTFGQTITFTLTAANTTSAGWLNGGRPDVYPEFAVTDDPNRGLLLYAAMKSEATEPLISFGNYRFSFYFNDNAYNASNIGITDNGSQATHNTNTYGNNNNRTPADFQWGIMPVPAGVDTSGGMSNGRKWNQRIWFQFFDSTDPAIGGVAAKNLNPYMYGVPNEYYLKRFFNNATYFPYGDLMSPLLFAIQVQPNGNAGRVAANWAPTAWSWENNMPPIDYGGFPPEVRPVSPDWSAGDGTSRANNLYDRFALENDTAYTQVLVEEWDGTTWRRVFGNGPLAGRDQYNVVVTDTIPSIFNWGGITADSSTTATASYNAGTGTVSFTIPTLQIGETENLKFWVTAKPDTGSNYNSGAGPFPWPVTNTASMSSASDSPITSGAEVFIWNVPPPTPTPVSDLKKSAAPTAVAPGSNVTFSLSYKNSQGLIYTPTPMVPADWTVTGFTWTANSYTNDSSGTGRATNNVVQAYGDGSYVNILQWDVYGYLGSGSSFFWENTGGTSTNGFWLEILPSDPYNARMNLYKDGVLIGSDTAIPANGNLTVQVVMTGTHIQVFINGQLTNIDEYGITPPAVQGPYSGYRNGAPLSGWSGAQQNALYAFRAWTDAAVNIQLWDTVPACFSFVSAQNGGTLNAGVVSWPKVAMERLAQGFTYTWVGQALAACACQNASNTARVDTLGYASQMATAVVTVACNGTATDTPTRTPTPSPSPSSTRTATPSATPSSSATPSPSPSGTPSRTPSGTPSSTATPSPSPSSTGTPSPTGTMSRTATGSATPSYTLPPTGSATNSPTASPSSTASATASSTRTATPSSTATPSPSPTASASPSSTASGTASPTSTLLPTGSATDTKTITVSSTASPTPSSTGTATPSSTATATATPTNTLLPTGSATDSPTASPSHTSSDTPSASVTASATPTASATASATASSTASATASGTSTQSPSCTASLTFSASPTPSLTFSASATRTATPTASASPSGTATRTLTSTRTATATSSSTRTPSATPTASLTFTASPTISVTSTKSPVVFYTVPPLILSPGPGVYPNPFSDQATIYVKLSADAQVRLAVYNVAGEKVRVLQIAGKRGMNKVAWKGDNNYGARCASGYYIVRLLADTGSMHDSRWLQAVITR